MAFKQTWTALQGQLRPRQVIPNWTAQRGLVGEPFEIVEMTSESIVVGPPGARDSQKVRRADFEAVYNRWPEYIAGTIPRSSFTPLTRYSKYVISILYWLHQQSGGRLP